MDTHIKFPSIKNTGGPSKRFCSKYPSLAQDQWQAREKLDGCNFCMIFDGKNLRGARRNAMLGEREEFHGYQAVLEKHRHLLEELYPRVTNNTTNTIIRVYGELIGNWYPHPDVPRKENVRRVHHCSTAYCPDVQFVAFDLSVLDPSHTYAECMEILEEVGFHVAPLITTGVLEDLIAVPPIFSSMIPSVLGLPELENKRNLAEGVVITHAQSKEDRHRFKHKPKSRSEVAATTTTTTAPRPDTDAYPQTLAEAQRYLTEERLNNVLSKMLPADHTNRSAVCKNFVQDALEDFQGDGDGTDKIKTLDDTERKRFYKQFSGCAYRVISEVYRNAR